MTVLVQVEVSMAHIDRGHPTEKRFAAIGEATFGHLPLTLSELTYCRWMVTVTNLDSFAVSSVAVNRT